MLRIAIVDDHPLALHGLRAILDPVADLDVVCCASTPDELPYAPDGAALFDVVILDLYLADGRAATDVIRTLSQRVAVLVMSASRAPLDALAAMQAGALGFVTKQSAVDVYADAIRTVSTGEIHLSSQLADLIQAAMEGPASPNRPELSPQERQTLMYVARGFTHQQTATRMNVSKSTVDTYIARIRAKWNLGNKAELTVAAFTYLRPETGPDRVAPGESPSSSLSGE